MATFVCPYCDTSKEMSASRAKLNRTCGQKDCRDRAPQGSGHGNKGRRTSEPRFVCPYCDTEVNRPPSQTRLLRTCGSIPCRDRYFAEVGHGNRGNPGLRGADNPAWKGGVDAEHHRGRSSRAAQMWRRGVVTRDNSTCQQCQSRVNLVAHHLKSWIEFPELRFDISNGITLCEPCHAGAHNKTVRVRRGKVTTQDQP